MRKTACSRAATSRRTVRKDVLALVGGITMTESVRNNRSILVTGSSRGIGRAIAERLAASGFRLVLHCRDNLAAAEEVRAAIVNAGGPGAAHSSLRHRRTVRTAPRRSPQDICGPWRVLSAWSATPGIARDSAFPALTDEDWDTVLRTNLGRLLQRAASSDHAHDPARRRRRAS